MESAIPEVVSVTSLPCFVLDRSISLTLELRDSLLKISQFALLVSNHITQFPEPVNYVVSEMKTVLESLPMLIMVQ